MGETEPDILGKHLEKSSRLQDEALEALQKGDTATYERLSEEARKAAFEGLTGAEAELGDKKGND